MDLHPHASSHLDKAYADHPDDGGAESAAVA
jgi:hypothetical protein